MRSIIAGVVISILVIGGIAAYWIFRSWGSPYTDVVQTKYGPIRGEELTFEGTNYKAFKGIPYASPPVGSLRFKAPEPPQKWTDVKDTRSYGYICHQRSPDLGRQSEDCLTLNVYTKSLDAKSLKPVLVFIHGGAFQNGESTDNYYGPEYLIKQDIIVVTINYRLGPLGFLATDNINASGNWGMKDQVAALKWIQDNIDQFGGNPKEVTIYGESAGSGSVHLHLFSPLSEGLFHKAITSSGTVGNDWVTREIDVPERFSRNMARVLGASSEEIEDPVKRIKFLRAADANTITARSLDVLEDKDIHPLLDPLPFAPVIEPYGSQNAFITEDPKTLLAEGRYHKVPLMMGVTDLEGALVLGPFHNKDLSPEGRMKIEENVCEILISPLKEAVIQRNDCPKVAQEIRNTYFDGQHFNSSFLEFIHLFGDMFMSRDSFWSLRMHAQDEQTPLYSYFFTFDGEWNFAKKASNVTLPGAAHADDLGYVFRPRAMRDLPPQPSTLPEVKTKDRMISFLTNFVTYSNPTPSVNELIPVIWKPVTKNESPTMHIGTDLTLEDGYVKTRLDMWDQLYKTYIGKPLYP